ncbi:MAG: SGNH/GDSL hydrolase family protein [Roseburia sp.]|nr:SGNH/GDSL hydrolase family protein [Roseburia sp.]
MTKKALLKKLIGIIFAELLLVMGLVWFFDPFYQYHKPFFGWQAVLNDRDNQMPGTVRNFDYDSVLVGSSVMENCDSSYLDEHFQCKTLKIARASGSVADLLYYLKMAQKEHSLKNVFWCLDLAALESSPVTTLQEGGDAPWYLHTQTPLDDVAYLCNKEVLLEKIPYMLAGERLGKNTGGRAYYWAEGKNFSAQSVISVYNRPKKAKRSRDFEEEKELVSANIELLLEQVRSHPEIRYRFFFPPYSMCWWDCAYVNGELKKNYYILEEAIPALLSCENVEVYYYQDEEEIICDLDNYMDLIHYCPAVNQYLLEQMTAGEGRVTKENWQKVIKGMRKLVKRIYREEIYRYYF